MDPAQEQMDVEGPRIPRLRMCARGTPPELGRGERYCIPPAGLAGSGGCVYTVCVSKVVGDVVSVASGGVAGAGVWVYRAGEKRSQ